MTRAFPKMQPILQMAWKEWRSTFGGWLGWVMLAGWAFFGGLAWAYALPFAANFSVAGIYANLLGVLVFLVPLLTMRSVAEERRDGTLDVLLSSPLSEWQIALGKWFGSLGFLLVLVLFTLPFPLLAWQYGSFDSGPLWSSLLILLLAGSAFCAWGLGCSSLTDSSVVAALACFGGLAISWLMGYATQIAPTNAIAQFLSRASLWTHCEPALRGALDTRDIVFFASLTLVSIWVCVRALQSRHWR